MARSRTSASLLDWIATRPELDKGRVVLSGASYGGWLALEAGDVYNDRIRGIIDGAAMTDFVTYLEQTDPARQDNRRAGVRRRARSADARVPESISPVTQAAQI